MDDKRDLSNRRLAQAEQCLREAKILFDNDGYKGAANRAYYSVFHSMRSLLAMEGVDFKSHKGVMSYFREKYIKTNILDNQLSRTLTDLYGIRSGSDYDDHYDIDSDEMEQHIVNTKAFYEKIKTYLKMTYDDA